jgi:hypothetical protein
MLSAFSPGKVANLTATISLYTMPIKNEGINQEACAETARRFWTGLVDGHNMAFAPTVAVFLIEARKIQEAMPLRGAGGQTQSKYHDLSIPVSKILERACTREWGRRLVEQGVHPRRSICEWHHLRPSP